MTDAPRPLVTGICLAALGIALFAVLGMDRAQESSGRSPLAREARDFASALQGRSREALSYLTVEDRANPLTQEEIRQFLRSIGPDADILVSQVRVEPGGDRGQSTLQILRPTSRGAVRLDQLPIAWVRTAKGEWKSTWTTP